MYPSFFFLYLPHNFLLNLLSLLIFLFFYYLLLTPFSIVIVASCYYAWDIIVSIIFQSWSDRASRLDVSATMRETEEEVEVVSLSENKKRGRQYWMMEKEKTSNRQQTAGVKQEVDVCSSGVWRGRWRIGVDSGGCIERSTEVVRLLLNVYLPPVTDTCGLNSQREAITSSGPAAAYWQGEWHHYQKRQRLARRNPGNYLCVRK